MEPWVSNVKYSAKYFDPTIGGLTGILVTRKDIWVACPSKGLVVAYKKRGKKSGCQHRSFNIPKALGLALLDKDVLVSTSDGNIYCISQCSDAVSLELRDLGTIGGIATRGNKYLYVPNISDNSLWIYKISNCGTANKNTGGMNGPMNGPMNGGNTYGGNTYGGNTYGGNTYGMNSGNTYGTNTSNYELIYRYGDNSLSSLSYAPVNVFVCQKIAYVVYNNTTSGIGTGYVNVLVNKCLNRLVNRGNLTQPYGAISIGSQLYVGSITTGTVSIYQTDIQYNSKHSNKKLTQPARYQNNLSSPEGGWLINSGVSQIAYCAEDNLIYMAVNADMGKIGSIEIASPNIYS